MFVQSPDIQYGDSQVTSHDQSSTESISSSLNTDFQKFTNQNMNIPSCDAGFTEILPVLNVDHSPINQNILGVQCSPGPPLSQTKDEYQIINPNKPHTSTNSSVSCNEDQNQISRLCQNEPQSQGVKQNSQSEYQYQSSRQNSLSEYQHNPLSEYQYQSSSQNPESEYQYQISTQNPQSEYQYQSSTQNPQSEGQCYRSEQKPLNEKFMTDNQDLIHFGRTEISHQNYHGLSNGLDTVNLQQIVKSTNRNKEVHYPQLQLCNTIPQFGRNHDLPWKTTVSDSYSDKNHRISTIKQSGFHDNSTHTNFQPFIFPMDQSVLYQNEQTIVDFSLCKNKSQSPSKIRKTKSPKAKPYIATSNSTQQETCDISCNDWTRVVSPCDQQGREFKPTACPNNMPTIFSYSKHGHHCNNLIGHQFLTTEQQQCSRLKSIVFGEPVSHIYNPLVYAFETHLDFINKYCTTEKKFLFLGMNPGPWGMAQNGVPFGEVDIVQNWLSIEGNVWKPKREHPHRPIHGLQCKRSEISGFRFWGLMRDISHHPDNFFKHCFVHNMCPLSFMTSSGKNITPPELLLDQRNQLNMVCDAMLSDVIRLLNVQVIIAVGKFVEARVEKVLKGQNFQNVTVKYLAHPSPLNRTANKGWRELARKQLEEFGVLPYLMGTTQTKDFQD